MPDWLQPPAASTWAIVLIVVLVAPLVWRLLRSLAIIGALAPAPVLLRWLAPRLHPPSFDESRFLGADGAPEAWRERRRLALGELAIRLAAAAPQARAWSDAVRNSFSDLRFTDVSRVPFPFAAVMQERFNLFSVVTASSGPRLQSLDGQWTLDVSGSYGLNVAGFDRYKTWIERGWEQVKSLGPVLGPLHPVVAGNVARLKARSGLEEVSFHMSGTEAVMAAVRLARFNTRRRLVVVFAGAYHGWWDGVQSGIGSERPLPDVLTLKDLHPASLAAIRRRASDIAAVLVNPVQAFHPNTPPPNDAVMMTSGVRRLSEEQTKYADWLRQLRETCSSAGVPLILDEVYTGFRLAPGGAQEYFGVRADMVVYGKTVAGGLPIGVVCGTTRLMRRADPDRPLRMAYVVGTFSAHPLVMGAMSQFLRWLEEPGTPDLYLEANNRCASWAAATNAALAEAGLPLKVAHLGTIWTVTFTESSRYNWLLQYYLRAEGLTLSWVGTGRCLCSLDFTADDYAALTEKVVNAARHMAQDGWWLTERDFPGKERSMRRQLFKETLESVVPRPVTRFIDAVRERKHDDHHASHNDAGNQYLHLLSSSAFIYCYAILATDLTTAMFVGLASLFIRQFGHAVLEPDSHDAEQSLLGFDTRSKTLIVLAYLAIPIVLMARGGEWTWSAFVGMADPIALLWWRWTLIVVFGRVAWLTMKFDLHTATVWFVKLVTDPFTDVVAYFPWKPRRA